MKIVSRVLAVVAVGAVLTIAYLGVQRLAAPPAADTSESGRGPSSVPGERRAVIPDADEGLPALAAEVVAEGLALPVQIAPAPDGRIFFNERLTGLIRVLEATGGDTGASPKYVLNPTAVFELKISAEGEQGLLGLALDPGFPKKPFLYAYHTYSDGDRVFNRVVRISVEDGSGSDLKVILDRIPAANFHNGGIIAFGPDGKLYIATGENGNQDLAQDKSTLAGKVLRINPDGSIPTDNPIRKSAIWTYGHRNVFGLAADPVSGDMFNTENGPDFGDELNHLEKGKNYGWPIVIGAASDPRFVDPLIAYDSVIAPTDGTFYTGEVLPHAYRNGLFFGDYLTGSLRFVQFDKGRTKALTQTIVLKFSPEVLLDVAQGPDGYIYVSTEGHVYRVGPG